MSTQTTKKNPAIVWGIFIAVMVATFLLGLLAASVTQRRTEAINLYNNQKVELTGIESVNAKWGVNYPREYETWKQTSRTDFKSKHLGNGYDDVLEARPEMVILWAGYAFSRDYSAPRGHMNAIEDQYHSLRTGTPVAPTDGPQPATCWACKSPDVPRLMQDPSQGGMGIDAFYAAKWGALGSEVVNPIGCANCHDPKTTNLVINQPALVEAFERKGGDIAAATTQEMRSLVCAQCHVEYYFKDQNGGKHLVFPWDKGMTVEAMEAYYDELKFTDWTHALSKTPAIKAQHPDYELFLLGTHGQRNVSCADCHMPYVSEGGVKFSNHQIMSPLQNISGTCGTCHRDSEDNLRSYVEQHQDSVLEVRNRLEPELAKAHLMAQFAWAQGATEAEMAPVLQLLRQAQWRWDFSVASHGASFHAPVEVQRIMAHGLDRTMQAQLELQKILFAHGNAQFVMPDISTKAKAQAYIGLDMDALNAAKKAWLQTTPPKWLEEAKQAGRI